MTIPLLEFRHQHKWFPKSIGMTTTELPLLPNTLARTWFFVATWDVSRHKTADVIFIWLHWNLKQFEFGGEDHIYNWSLMLQNVVYNPLVHIKYTCLYIYIHIILYILYIYTYIYMHVWLGNIRAKQTTPLVATLIIQVTWMNSLKTYEQWSLTPESPALNNSWLVFFSDDLCTPLKINMEPKNHPVI